MKRAILCLLALSLLLTGCSSGISQADYDAVVAERDKALEQIKTLNEKLESAVDISDGTVLVDGTWENGSVLIVALDDTTLLVQIVDDRRPAHAYNDMGTLWELELEYGEAVDINHNGYILHNVPYSISLRSPAYAESGMVEYELGNLPSYDEEEMRTLRLTKTTTHEDGSRSFDPDVYLDHNIRREGNTYTAMVTLPEWFDVSAVNDLTGVRFNVFNASYWHDYAEMKGAEFLSYPFDPYEKPEASEQNHTSESESAETVSESPTETTVDISEGTVLIDGSWENGSVQVVALDDSTLWMQVVDDRPYTYKDMGTVWKLRLEYGEPIETEFNGHIVHNIPYEINLRSPAYAESGVAECDLGNWPWYYEEYMRTLWLAKTIMYEDGSHLLDPDVYIDHEIERTGNTYTATVSLPEWFDVSAVNDLTCVAVDLFDASFWHDLAENGSASTTDSYTFKP